MKGRGAAICKEGASKADMLEQLLSSARDLERNLRRNGTL